MTLEEIKKLERRFYFRCAAAIVIGIILIAAGWKLKGLFSGILVIGGIIILLIALILFSKYLEIFTRARGLLREAETGEEYKETYIKWPPWLKKWGGILYLILVIFGIGFLGRMHENDFGGLKFLWHSVVAGLLSGPLIFYILKFRFPHWADNKNKSVEIAFYITLLTLLIFVCFGPLVNRYFATAPVICNEYKIEHIGKNYAKGITYLHVLTPKGKERFNPPAPFFKKLGPADTVVTLCIRKGSLSYDYVEEFRLPRINY